MRDVPPGAFHWRRTEEDDRAWAVKSWEKFRAGSRAMSCPEFFPATPAVATLFPVAEGEGTSSSESSAVALLVPLVELTSIRSFMPEGRVTVVFWFTPKNPITIVLGLAVVMEGAVTDTDLPLVCPPAVWTGAAPLTPV